MGNTIPVFFLPIDEHEIPRQIKNWEDGTDLLNKYYDEGYKVGMRTASSRNWWLEQILDESAKALQIEELEFICGEITLLGAKELRRVSAALDVYLEKFTKGSLPLNPEAINRIWYFHDQMNLIDLEELFKKALNEAEPFYDSYVTDGYSSYQGVVDFFSFVKTVQTSGL